jgi:hypothetical protein
MEEDEEETREEYSEDNVGEEDIDVEGASPLVSGKERQQKPAFLQVQQESGNDRRRKEGCHQGTTVE